MQDSMQSQIQEIPYIFLQKAIENWQKDLQKKFEKYVNNSN